MVEVRKVSNQRQLRRFIDFRTELYKDCPTAVPYLYMDEERTLNPLKNGSFESARPIIFWLGATGR